MSTKQKTEVTVLTDNVDGYYSIGCESCGETVTHSCATLPDEEDFSHDYPMRVMRNKSDLVYALGCAFCGMLDISPFAEDILISKTNHKKFHDYVLDLTHNSVDYYHPIDIFCMECDWLDTLEKEVEAVEYHRLSRRDQWAEKIHEEVKLAEEGEVTND